MNYSVHAVMYSYYFLMELKLWPKWLRYASSLPPFFPPSLPFFLPSHRACHRVLLQLFDGTQALAQVAPVRTPPSLPLSFPPPFLDLVVSFRENSPFFLSLPPSLVLQPHFHHPHANRANASRRRDHHRLLPLRARPFLWGCAGSDPLVRGYVCDVPVLFYLVFRGAILAFFICIFFPFVKKREWVGRRRK